MPMNIIIIDAYTRYIQNKYHNTDIIYSTDWFFRKKHLLLHSNYEKIMIYQIKLIKVIFFFNFKVHKEIHIRLIMKLIHICILIILMELTNLY